MDTANGGATAAMAASNGSSNSSGNGSATASKPAAVPHDPDPVDTREASASGGIWCGIKIPVVGVSGEKGSGKTLFMLSIDPESTCYVDLEKSSETYSVPVKKRLDLFDEMVRVHGPNHIPSAMECWIWFRDFVVSIQPGEYTVLAVDPISDIEAGAVDYVRANPEEFGISKGQVEKAPGLVWGAVKSYLKAILGILASKVETFAFSTHQGNVWSGGKPVPGKRKAKGKDILAELASLYVEVQRKPDANGKVPAKPVAITTGKDPYKCRLSISTLEGDEWIHRPILPPRVDGFTPAKIREYIKAGGVNFAKLKKAERLESEELSEDDRLILRQQIAEDERLAEEGRLERQRKAEENQRAIAERRRQQEADAAHAMAGKPAGPDAEKPAAADPKAEPKAEPKADPPADPETPRPYDRDGMLSHVAELIAELRMSGENVARACGKRQDGATRPGDLADEQLGDLHRALQSVHDKRTMQIRLGEAAGN